MIHPDRILPLNHHTSPANGPVIYWMLRDQRAHHNWALLYAQQQAIQFKQPLHVLVSLRLDLAKHLLLQRTLTFMLQGLKQLESDLKKHNISFHLLIGSQPDTILSFIQQNNPSLIVTDFSPLKPHQQWHTN